MSLAVTALNAATRAVIPPVQPTTAATGESLEDEKNRPPDRLRPATMWPRGSGGDGRGASMASGSQTWRHLRGFSDGAAEEEQRDHRRRLRVSSAAAPLVQLGPKFEGAEGGRGAKDPK